jgi:uncharacterized membrane protein YccC
MAAAERASERAVPGGGSISLRRAVARLAQPSPSAAYALRFAVATSAAIWIGHLPGLVTNESQWILITVLMVVQPVAGGSLMKGLLRALGTAAAAVTAILLFGAFSQDPPWLLAGLFLVQAVAGYGFTGSRYQYAWFVWAFTTAIVLGDALAGGGDVETLAFQRASMVGIGLLIAFVVDAVFWPTRSEPALRLSLAERARALAGALRRAVEEQPASPGAEEAAASTLSTQLGQAEAAQTELGVSRARLETLRRVALLLEGLASRERMLRETPAASAAPELAPALAELGACVEASLVEAAEALGAERAPGPHGEGLERGLAGVRAALARDPEEAALRESRVVDVADVVGGLHLLEESLDGLAPTSSPRTPSAPLFPLRLDPFRLQIGLRAAIAVCAALLGVMALGWDTNTTVAPVAFMLACTPTRGATAQTVLVLTGVLLLGWLLADLAIVFALPHLDRIPLALVLPFAVAGGLAWLGTKRPALAILPSVGGLLAILPVFGGMATPTDVYGPYSTTCYLALGVGVAWVSTRLFWPATAATLFRQGAAAQLELCLEALRADAPDAPTRRRLIARALGAHAAQTARLAKLHGQALHEPLEHALDEPRRAQWITLAQDLFDAVLTASLSPAARSDGGPEARAALLEALDEAKATLASSIEATASTLRSASAPPAAPLAEVQGRAEERIDALRRAIAEGWAPDPTERASLLRRIHEQRVRSARQLAVEGWVTEWQTAAGDRSA